MIGRLVLMATVLISAWLLGSVVFPAVAVGGWTPDLVVLTVLAFALADGPLTGLRYGFLAGLSTDLLFADAQLVGQYALVTLTLGYVAGLARPYLSGNVAVGRVLVAGLGGALAVAAHGGLGLLLDAGPYPAVGILRGAVVTGLYNAALAPLVCAPIAAISRRHPPFGAQATSSRS